MRLGSITTGSALLFIATCAWPACGDESRYTKYVQSHLDRVIQRSVDNYGPVKTRLWLATMDTTTGGLPEDPLPRQLRWYRKITFPRRIEPLLGSANHSRGPCTQRVYP